MDRLAAYRFPRNKLSQLCDSGEIIRVKKGLFVPAPFRGEPGVDPLVLAALIYGPSYVSVETALARHGLIPERIDEITCMSTKRARVFETPVGRFSYHPIHPRAFAAGVRLEEAAGGAFLIAGPEKAICDRLALVSGVRSLRDIPALLEEDLRLDLGEVLSLDGDAIREIARLYRRNTVTSFAKWFARQPRPLPAA
ncbi:MAG: hypothetical protein R3F11_33105 [Verrucomicrobiales bacterium]